MTTLWTAVLSIAACSSPNNGGDGGGDVLDAAVDRPAVRWSCPPEWVAYARGGCGPAVIVCVPDGGAASGACDGIDIGMPRVLTDDDGGTGSTFFRLSDGAIQGAWHRPGDPGGPPAADFLPDAGIPTCPAGWTRRPDGVCDPRVRTDCPAGSGPLPGGACTPTSVSDCPAGPYADVGAEAMGATVVHVRAGADPSVADGTPAQPFATLSAGLGAAGKNGWVLVAEGTYADPLIVTSPVHIIGVCTARVVLNPPVTPADVLEYSIDVRGMAALLDLRGVHLARRGRGIRAVEGGRATLRSVWVENAVLNAVIAEGTGTLRVEDSWVTGTSATGPSGPAVGIGAVVGGTLEAHRVSVDRVSGIGIGALAPRTTFVLTDAVVRNGQRPAGGDFGIGLEAGSGAALTVTRVVVEAGFFAGAYSVGAGSSLVLTDAVVQGVRRGLAYSGGLVCSVNARLSATRTLVQDNDGSGASAHRTGAVINLVDSVVRQNGVRAGDEFTLGFDVPGGGVATATRVIIAGARGVGAGVRGIGSRFEISDSIVRGTRALVDGSQGYGLAVVAGGSVIARRTVISESHEAGISVEGVRSSLVLEESIVRGTRPRADGRLGRGVVAGDGAAIAATRVLLLENTDVGAAAFGAGTRLALDDSVVARTLARPSSEFGCGLYVDQGASLSASRTLVSDSRESGALAFGAGSTLVLADVAVEGTRPRSDGAQGGALSVQLGASLDGRRILLSDNQVVGLFAHGEGSNARLADVDMLGPREPSEFAPGVLAEAGAQIDLARFAIIGASGFGAAATRGDDAGLAARLIAVDLFVASIRNGAVRRPLDGVSVHAYGLSVGPGCELDATRAVLDGGGFGLVQLSGSLLVHSGVLTRHTQAAIAWDGVGAVPMITDAGLSDNADDGTRRDTTLAVPSTPAAERPCARAVCE